jgi:hypothetical protein
MVPPAVLGSGQYIGGGTAAQTEYTFSFSDFILDETSYVQPCNAGSLVSLTYNDSLLPQDGLPYDVVATCRVPGHEASRDITACDTVNHCTTVTIIPSPAPDAASIAILDPLNNSAFPGPGAKTVSGGAYDLDEIQSIVVRVDGAILDTIIPAPSIVDTAWSTTWTPIVSGTYTISATLTDLLNNELVDTVQVTVGGGEPTAVTMGTIAATTAANRPLLLLLWAGLLLVATGIAVHRRRRWNEY